MKGLYRLEPWVKGLALASVIMASKVVGTAPVDSERQLLAAAEQGDLALVKQLINEKKVNVNCKDRLESTPIIWASFKGHTELVQFLLSQPGIKINCRGINGKTALIVAAEKGHVELVRLP